MENILLTDILIIFAMAIGVLLICHAIGLPTIVGFLITGLIAGPHGLALIKEVEEVGTLAEVGLIFLMFTIGLEFSLGTLAKMRRLVLIGGSLQVLLTTGVTAAIVINLFGRSLNEGIFFGFLVALSSTAIVMRLVQERADVDTPHGRTIFGTLILQDLAILPMILLVPLLANGNGADTHGVNLVTALGALILLAVAARWGIKPLLFQAARTRSREVFMLSVVVIGLAVAWLTSSIGLSLALGAFLAGLIISESEYSNQALGNILPFRDLFISFFFVSVGMLLDWRFVVEHPVLVLALTVGVILLKGTLATGVALIMRYPVRTAVMSGLALSQLGEFSFILADTGIDSGLLDDFSYQMFLAVSVLSMAATPFLVAAAPGIASAVNTFGSRITKGRMPGSHSERQELLVDRLDFSRMEGHLVIVGFGLSGRNLARAAEVADVPFVILEADPEIVRQQRRNKEPIFWGDASEEAVLKHINVKEANVVVIAISDAAATRRAVELCRRLNKSVHIIARTKYLSELKPLAELGASEVIAEEFETSIEIFHRVLRTYKVPIEEIEAFATEIRNAQYEMFRQTSGTQGSGLELKQHFPGLEVVTLPLGDHSPLVGRKIGEVDLKEDYGLTVLLIRRGDDVIPNPPTDTVFMSGDLVCGISAPGSSRPSRR